MIAAAVVIMHLVKNYCVLPQNRRQNMVSNAARPALWYHATAEERESERGAFSLVKWNIANFTFCTGIGSGEGWPKCLRQTDVAGCGRSYLKSVQDDELDIVI